MKLETLEQGREILTGWGGRLLGVGVTAFPRLTPCFLAEGYELLCLRPTRDLPLLKDKVLLRRLQAPGAFEEGWNSLKILAEPASGEILRQGPTPLHLFLYQSYEALEAMAAARGWVLLANREGLRRAIREQTFLDRALGALGHPPIPGGVFPLRTLWGRSYGAWEEDFGGPFVVQIAGNHGGGGRGTFFIGSEGRYREVRGLLEGGTWRGSPVLDLSLRRFASGTPTSLAVCVLRQGVLVSGLQRQLIDLPFCVGMQENGIFCGHVWERDVWPEVLCGRARALGLALGEILSGMGYRGIFGVDLIIDRDTEKIHVLEINPRMTGVFPMLSFLHMNRGIPPMELFHLLAFLDLPFEVDIRGMNLRYGDPLEGGQVLLFRMHGPLSPSLGALGAGRYRTETGGLRFLAGSLETGSPLGPGEFLLLDGPPCLPEGAPVPSDPLHRLGRLLFFSCPRPWDGDGPAQWLKAEGALRQAMASPGKGSFLLGSP